MTHQAPGTTTRPDPDDAADVVVVGAGPTGLTCALLLARDGVRVRVVDGSPSATTQARAMFLHVRTLELWDRLGIADTAVRRGAPITGVGIWRGGRPAGTLSLRDAFTGNSRFRHALGLPQDQTQRLLLEALAAHPSARVSWGTRVTDLRQDDDGVTLDLDTADGPTGLRAGWVVGADGGSSTVRALLGIAMPGLTYPLPEFGADVDLPPGLPTDQMITSSSMARGLSVMPIGGGRHRVFGTVTPALQALLGVTGDGSDVPLPAVVEWFRSVLPAAPAPTAVHRSFAYRIHRRVADHFRDRRVFLAGDAAHMNAPAGGQGINLGMGDGDNLGWKLSLVARGLAHPALLDSYQRERRPLAITVVAAVDRVYRADTSTGGRISGAVSGVTNRLTARSLRVPLVRDTIADLMSQTWISYRGGPVLTGRPLRTTPRAGDRLPTHALPAALRDTRLHAIVLDGPGPYGDGGDDLARELDQVLSGYCAPVAVHRERHHGPLHRTLRARGPLIAVVRPDGHLLFRSRDRVDLEPLRHLLDRLLVVESGIVDAEFPDPEFADPEFADPEFADPEVVDAGGVGAGQLGVGP